MRVCCVDAAGSFLIEVERNLLQDQHARQAALLMQVWYIFDGVNLLFQMRRNLSYLSREACTHRPVHVMRGVLSVVGDVSKDGQWICDRGV